MFLLIFLVLLFTISGMFTLFYISQFTSPLTSSGQIIVINLIYFFTSLWISLAGTISLVLYWVGNFRLKKNNFNETRVVHKPKLIFKQSLRHGVLFATGICAIGLLNVFNFASSLNIILVIIAVALIEIYFFGH